MNKEDIVAYGIYAMPHHLQRVRYGKKPILVKVYKNRNDAYKEIDNNRFYREKPEDRCYWGYMVLEMKWIPKGIELN